MKGGTREAWKDLIAFLDASDSLRERRLLPLARLAEADPILGNAYPFTAMWGLSFGQKPDYPDAASPRITAIENGRYLVSDCTYPPHGGTAAKLAETASVDVAVSMARHHFPG